MVIDTYAMLLGVFIKIIRSKHKKVQTKVAVFYLFFNAHTCMQIFIILIMNASCHSVSDFILFLIINFNFFQVLL